MSTTSPRYNLASLSLMSLKAKSFAPVVLFAAALVVNLILIAFLILFIVCQGTITFWPKKIAYVQLSDGTNYAGEIVRYSQHGQDETLLLRTGNYELTQQDYIWIDTKAIRSLSFPKDFYLVERREWGVFIGQLIHNDLDGETPGYKFKTASGDEKFVPSHLIVRLYPANAISWIGQLQVYGSRWWEYLTAEPREANTEGGIFPALVGTLSMTLLLAILVTPFGVITAIYLREYAHQGALVAAIRICVNNLAGVPSIVYGVFGLGFFAYTIGAKIDQWLFYDRLPTPTFGTGGLLWASLTLALLTVPVMIVATEEALSAVPKSMREGSLACGATQWQTLIKIVLPQAVPGILTGLILVMARGAGEVAPLMLVGVVKLAPELPIDFTFPFIHLERSFMHLGFHIFDVGFQSRNAEAGKPMVFVTTLTLLCLIFTLNFAAISLRNKLKQKLYGGHF